MNCPQRFPDAPCAEPRRLACSRQVLLADGLPASLLRQLDGCSPSSQRLTTFTDSAIALTELASDSLDAAVLVVTSAAHLDVLLPELTRVARQGLLRFA